jgi:Ca2+/Na+ antiporter
MLFQLFSLLFFEEAFVKFCIFRRSELYECLRRSNSDTIGRCGELYVEPDITIGQLISEPIHFMMFGLVFGLILTSIVNWIRKKSLWNTVSVVLLYLFLFFIGAFKYRFINQSMNWFAGNFSNKIAVSSLIGSQIAFLFGILLVWLSVKNFTHQKDR